MQRSGALLCYPIVIETLHFYITFFNNFLYLKKGIREIKINPVEFQYISKPSIKALKQLKKTLIIPTPNFYHNINHLFSQKMTPQRSIY